MQPSLNRCREHVEGGQDTEWQDVEMLLIGYDALLAEVTAWRACEDANLIDAATSDDGIPWKPDAELINEARRLRAQNEGGERG
jgi:hypothetical protein